MPAVPKNIEYTGRKMCIRDSFSDRVANALYQPVNGESFLFMKDVGGGEFFQLYRYDLATGGVTLLTDGKSRNTDPVSYTHLRNMHEFSASLEPCCCWALFRRRQRATTLHFPPDDGIGSR